MCPWDHDIWSLWFTMPSDHHHHHHQSILYPNLHYSLHCSLSAYTGSIYCRPQCARPSKLTVIGCLCAHECLTSKTFLFNLQSNNGSCPPHHKVPWISGPHCSLTTSSLASLLWTSRTHQVFLSICHHTAFSIHWQHSKIFSHQHTWIVLKSLVQFLVQS